MQNIKKEWQHLLKWALQSNQNRKRAILNSLVFINLIISQEKKIDRKDIEKIFAATKQKESNEDIYSLFDPKSQIIV